MKTIDEIQRDIDNAARESDRGNTERAQEIIQRVLDELERCAPSPEYLHLKCVALRNYGVLYMRSEQMELALEYAAQALSLAEQTANFIEQAQDLSLTGIVYSDMKEDFVRALEYFQRGLDISEQHGLVQLAARIRSNMGVVYIKMNDTTGGLEQLTLALNILESFENKDEIIRGNIGNIFFQLANVYRALHLDDNAIEYYQKGLSIFEDIGRFKVLYATGLQNLGTVYMQAQQFDLAMEYLTKSLLISQELHHKASEALVLGNIGTLYSMTDNHEKALEYYYQALEINEAIGNKANTASMLSNIGSTYATPEFHGYNADKAEEFLLRGIDLASELGVQKPTYYHALSELYRTEERWKESDTMFRKAAALKEELNAQQTQLQILTFEQRRQVAEREKEIAIAKARTEAQIDATTSLLHKVLPSVIAERIMNGERIADYFENVSILFADIVGFTPIAAKMSAADVLAFLNYIVKEFDMIMEHHGCQKIKTMGDGYMAVCGAPERYDDHAERLAAAAQHLLNDIVLPDDIRSSLPTGSVFHLRIGLHCGPAFAGIVGEKGFVYDVYSDAVNLAARMESHGEPGRIHCSEEFKNHVESRSLSLRFAERGKIDIKGKGLMTTYFLESNNISS